MQKELLFTFGPTNEVEDAFENKDKRSSISFKETISAKCKKVCRRKNLYNRLPILKWSSEYNTSKFIADLIAGLTLGLTTIPQVLGVANVAEIPPEYGLYSAFIGQFVYILFGSTNYITIGPTTTTAIVTLSYTKGMPPEFSVLLCFCSGVVLLILCLLDLGFIVDFISTPVTSAFTSAAAISIASTQIKGLLGIKFSANGFLEEITGVIEHIKEVQLEDFIVAFLSLFFLYLFMKIQDICKRFGKISSNMDKFLWYVSTSRSVIVVLVATVIYGIRGDPPGLGVVGHVPSGLPEIKPPPFSYIPDQNSTYKEFTLKTVLEENFSVLIVIPLVAFMEHITICKALTSTTIDGTQELFTLSLSNLIGSFFSSMPVTGAFGRTALNFASGAQSPLGGFVTGSIILLALQFIAPQFYYIPKPTLNSVVVMAVVFMVDFNVCLSIWKTRKSDLIPWTITFLTSLFLGLEYGIISGFGISVVFVLYNAARPTVCVSSVKVKNDVNLLWLEFDRSLTFASIEYVRSIASKSTRKWDNSENMPIVFDCQHVQVTDYTVSKGMSNILKDFQSKGRKVIIWKLKAIIQKEWQSILKETSGAEGVCFCENEKHISAFLDNNENDLLVVGSVLS